MTRVAGYIGKYNVKKENKDFYYYVITLGKDANGKRIQIKKRGFKTKKEAEKALREAQVEADKGAYIQPSKMTYGEYLTEWIRAKKQQISSQTAHVTEVYMRTHIVPELGGINLTQLNPLIIQRFLSTLQDKGLADSTIKRIYNIVNTSLNAAVKKQIINRNAASLIDKPRVKRKEIEVWDVNEVKAFLNYARSYTRYYIAFHLALTTGMRQGEILGLRWMDVDFDRKMISVRQTLSHNGKEIIHGAKTATSIRSISFDTDTATDLQKHMRMVRREMLSLGKSLSQEDLVVCNGLGTKANPRNINRIWYKLLEKTELKKITFHDLRHTNASLLLKINTHPKIVSERLGHSSIKITIDLYSHLFPNMQEEAAAELAKLLF